MRMGELEVTPLRSGHRRWLWCARSTQRLHGEKNAASLVLRLKFKNLSEDHPFAPLERRFLREQTTAAGSLHDRDL